jgi:hypothetical protein
MLSCVVGVAQWRRHRIVVGPATVRRLKFVPDSVLGRRDAARMRWEEILGPDRAEALRRALLGALEDAYAENCQRHSPDDLGDNNMTFGVAVSQNLRFLAERAVEDIAGVEIIRPRGSFALLIDDKYQLYFYKAPPGVFDVRALRFDASVTQHEVIEQNFEQLSWRFDSSEDSGSGDATHIVAVHFGDPIEGLHRVDIGAPLESPTDGLQWDWLECLSDASDAVELSAEELDDDDDEQDEDFGLRLRDPSDEEGMDMGEASG